MRPRHKTQTRRRCLVFLLVLLQVLMALVDKHSGIVDSRFFCGVDALYSDDFMPDSERLVSVETALAIAKVDWLFELRHEVETGGENLAFQAVLYGNFTGFYTGHSPTAYAALRKQELVRCPPHTRALHLSALLPDATNIRSLNEPQHSHNTATQRAPTHDRLITWRLPI
jgi:hypothetical protein